MSASKSVVLKASLDEGLPGPEHFDIVENIVNDPQQGEIQVQILAMSADPYLRIRIKSESAFGAVKPGSVMDGFVVGKVVRSNGVSKWSEGDTFGAMMPFTTIQNLSEEKLASTLMWKLSDMVSEDELTLGLGILGMPGSTAYGGLVHVLRPNIGETIFVSAASGAVGSLVGMIAKNVYNCTVIGSCGGPEKCALIKEKFGFDHAIDYKTVSSAEELKAAILKVAPDGIDMYFENVGGIHFDAAFSTLRTKGRIAVCGGISEYNASTPEQHPSFNPMNMVYTMQRIEGFLAGPYLTGQEGNFLQDMHKFLRDGKIVKQETEFQGIESWPMAFQALFTGKNKGKVVV
eukprot:CAMPEP_0185039032 /NCGR_PEP_ID=MMETSP1103-20130426/35443_1 /TAXON_ID=36769 /ORGANISM="Paraphysomonas bandaiensis, Strain Caron Lab Isolate" /LENGTH=345 /DNA_ID=CAMNT_0027577761 /DNA_START=19 /DNA_END=1053 /DNA_ORIENTATION=-